MNRRDFLKMMTALGAVPSLGMLRPAPQPVPYLYPDASLPLRFAELRAENDRAITQGLGIPEYVFKNNQFLTHRPNPDDPSWRVLT